MKKAMLLLTLSSFFFLSSTAMAKIKVNKTIKTKRHHCAVYTKNAKKARQLYSQNKIKAVTANQQVQALQKDQKRMPASTKLAKKVVSKKIQSLSNSKRQHLMNSLKYLEKHIQYSKAAKRNCASHKIKRFRSQDLERIQTIASN